MKIAIDLRSLQSGRLSGVENYTLNLLERLLPFDSQNSYTLFYNSWGKSNLPDLHFVNSQMRQTRYPNKILNLGLKFGLTKLEKLAGNFDCLFMPNLNQFNIRSKAKLALTVHDLSPVVTPEFYNFKRRLWHKFLNYSKAFARADIIFAVSEFTKQDLVKIFNIPEGKIKVIYPGIDKNVFNPEIKIEKLREVRNIYSLPGDFILFLNTIEPRKNLVNLIKAFENLNGPEYLVIAGKRGWKENEIFRTIAKSPKRSRIKYIGYVEEADKPALIKMAKILAYPSFYEGFGFQPLEAMAVGTPTIVSQVTALPEVVGGASLLINPYNIVDLTKAMEEILNSEDLRKKLVAKGMTRVSEFNWDTSAKKVLEELNKLNF